MSSFFVFFFFFFFFKQKTAYEIMPSLVGSEMCIRDRLPVPPLSDSAGNPVDLAQPGPVPAPRTYPRRLTTHRGNPQRHRSRTAHAAGQTPALRALAAVGERAVEMTEPENPQKQNRRFSGSLESAKNKGALSTFPPPRLRLLDWFRI